MNFKKLLLVSSLALATIPFVLHSCKKDSTDSSNTTTTSSSTTSSTSTTSTTSSTESFVFNGITMPALMGNCDFGFMDFTVTGTQTNQGISYTLTMLFPDSAPASGVYTAVFAGAGTSALAPTNCRANLEVLNTNNNITQLLKAADGEKFTLTELSKGKYTVSFGSNKFTIVSGSSATRYASATAFGCTQ
ncbi:hypothetical protein AEM51_05485 [Bacteroidetes bacterium UKL13-3]|nr:hypothetical protein AEM51_05485 [Bacteroidetes bacterium UKL13-3]HCP94790.1 hypothetical protein [Bacteroidota bacterium]